MLPYYLKNHLKEISFEQDSFPGAEFAVTKARGILVSSTGNDQLEIHYYGELNEFDGNAYIATGDLPCLVVAKDPVSGEEITVFDANIHGYDAMFCGEPMPDLERPLQRYDLPAGQFAVCFEYSIDYDSEKDDYSFDEDGKILLADGTPMDYETAKSIGYTWFWLTSTESGKDLVDMELA